MSKFLTGEALNTAIDDIIWGAELDLLIVSPYIKLDNHFKKLFDKHLSNPNLHLMLVFGKNEKAVKRSMSKDDFDYFKKFPNVSIIYVPNLHAKYYGNEKRGVITSINLYDYSFIHNIEFGVFSEQGFVNRFTQSADNDAWNKCMEVAESNEVVFINRPIFQNKGMLMMKSKNFMGSETLFDSTDKFYGDLKKVEVRSKRLEDFPHVLEFGQKIELMPSREVNQESTSPGYCIRSGVQIKYNPKNPMSKDAWKKWNEFKNEDYPEKFCHRTGQPSNGKTSMKSPILA